MNERNVEPLAHRSRRAWLSRALVLWSDAPRHTRACKYAYTCVCVSLVPSRPVSSRPVTVSSRPVASGPVLSRASRKEYRPIARKLYTVHDGTSIFEDCSTGRERTARRVASRPILRSTRRYYDISILLMYSNALYRV